MWPASRRRGPRRQRALYADCVRDSSHFIHGVPCSPVEPAGRYPGRWNPMADGPGFAPVIPGYGNYETRGTLRSIRRLLPEVIETVDRADFDLAHVVVLQDAQRDLAACGTVSPHLAVELR